jgi:predicted HTH transcriptional regulator
VFDITKFYQYREDNRMEVKKAKGGLPASLWETYSSFANCYGGVIILGVVENKDGSWRTTGLEEEAKLRKEFWDSINNKNKVNVNLLMDKDVETYNEGNDVIMVIRVPKAKREVKPVYINKDIFSGTFRRNWEGDYHCDRNEVLAMLRDQPETTSDMKVLENLSVDVLDLETLHGYRNRHMSFKPGHTWEKYDDIKYMEKIGAVAASDVDGELHPTAAGLLMFGEEYKIVREFPEFFLDYREILDPSIRWTDRFQSSSGDWTGNLFEFYFRVYNKITKDLKVPFKIQGGDRIDDTPMHKAIREALANCLINADYYGRYGVVIKKEPDILIFENPGDVRTGKEQMLRGGMSDPRNKALMKMFSMINVGERAGSGVPDIYAVWDNEGWKEPIVDEKYNPDRTILTLSFKNKESGDKKAAIKSGDKKAAIKSGDKKVTNKQQQQYEMILNYMKKDKEYGIQDFCNLLQLKESRTKDILKGLVENGNIETIGAKKDRRYRLV